MFDPKVFDHRSIVYVDINFNVNQIGELVTSAKDFTNQRIIIFAGGHWATMELPKRKLDSLGYIKYFSGVHNDPDRLICLTNKLEIAQYLDSIYDDKIKEYVAHKAACKAETRLLVPAPKNKLISRGTDTKKLTRKEIVAVLEVYYGKKETDNKNNPILDDILKA